MNMAATQDNYTVMIAVMGATGTGKSTFINLLTKDNKIQIGHSPESETLHIQVAQYNDRKTGRTVVLIDTPGFDDSREGVTDTDTLEKIVGFLEPANTEGRKLNGIIYMHRISDPRVGGLARKNLRMLQALCGDSNLDHVCIVTTNWGRISEQEGTERQDALERGVFRSVVDAGARVCRHEDTIESAQRIVSELVPLQSVTMQIQVELRSGKTLADTSAGAILTAELQEQRKKHEQELSDLRREMEDAAEVNDATLRAELEQEHKELMLKMARAEEDRDRLKRTLELAPANPAIEQSQYQGGSEPFGLPLMAFLEPLGAVVGGLVVCLVVLNLNRALFGR